jgi:hypothetical protein
MQTGNPDTLSYQSILNALRTQTFRRGRLYCESLIYGRKLICGHKKTKRNELRCVGSHQVTRSVSEGESRSGSKSWVIALAHASGYMRNRPRAAES